MNSAGPAWRQGLNLVADGDIPTTSIIRQVLVRLVADGNVQTRYGVAFDDGLLAERPTLFSRVSAGSLSWVPRFLTQRGGHYALFIDDNFWECDVTPELAAYYGHPLVRRTLDEFVRQASVVIVNSNFLAGRLEERFPGASVRVVPAHFDFSAIDPSLSPPARPHGSPLRIGYAGTSRGDAFNAVVEAIVAVLRERPGEVEFEFIGFVPESLKGLPGVTAFPPTADYRQFLALKQSRQWDVGLAPLGASAFTRAKTNNKFREYGALSIAGIYQDVEPYRGSVEDGVDGLLVGDSAGAWHAAIVRLIDDRAAVRRMGDAAHAQVRARHDLAHVTARWAEALDEAGLSPIRESFFGRMPWRTRLWAAGWQLRAREYAMVMRQSGLRGVAARLAGWVLRLLRLRKA